MEQIRTQVKNLQDEIYKNSDSLLKSKGYTLSKASKYLSENRSLPGFSKSRLSELFSFPSHNSNINEVETCYFKLTRMKRVMEAAPHYEDSILPYSPNPNYFNSDLKGLLDTVWRFYYYQKSDKNNDEKIKLACIIVGRTTNDVKCYTNENFYNGSIDTRLSTSIRIEMSLIGGRPVSITCPIGQGTIPDIFLGGYVNLTESSFLSMGIGIIVKDPDLNSDSDFTAINKHYKMDDPKLDPRITEFFTYKDQFYTKIEQQVYSMQNLDNLNAALQRKVSNREKK
jgi:hypothetical protein